MKSFRVFLLIMPLFVSTFAFGGSDSVKQLTSIHDLLGSGRPDPRCEDLLESAGRAAAGFKLLYQTHAQFLAKSAEDQLLDVFNILYGLRILIDYPSKAKDVLPKGMTLEIALYKTQSFVKQSIEKNKKKDPQTYFARGAEILMVLGQAEDIGLALMLSRSMKLFDPVVNLFMDLSDVFIDEYSHIANAIGRRNMGKEFARLSGDSEFSDQFDSVLGGIPNPEGSELLISHLTLIRATRLFLQVPHGNLHALTGELIMYSQLVANLATPAERAPYSQLTVGVLISYAEAFLAIEKVGKRPLKTYSSESQYMIKEASQAAVEVLLQHWYDAGFVVTPQMRELLPKIEAAVKNKMGAPPVVQNIYQRLFVILSGAPDPSKSNLN